MKPEPLGLPLRSATAIHLWAKSRAWLPGTLQLLVAEVSLFLRLEWRRERKVYENRSGTHRALERPLRGDPRASAYPPPATPNHTSGVSGRALPWRPHWSVSAWTQIVGRCCRVLPQVAARVVLVVVFGLRVPEQHG